jgi:glycosyltransferase involved in cell wall biosynthesis
VITTVNSHRPARRPRVLQVVQRYFPELGGLETHVGEVSRRLAARGDFDLSVLTTDRTGRLPKHESMDGYQVIRRRSWPRERDYYFSPGLAVEIIRGDWDLVHFQGVHTLVPPVGMLAATAARVPYALTFHSGGHSSDLRSAGRGLQWRVLTPLLRAASALIAVSRFERDHFGAATGIDPSRFTVIPNGGALPPVAVGERPVPGRIVSSGRLEKYKGHHRVIEALPIIRKNRPEAHLVVLGSGPYEGELRALAERLGVADAVSWRTVAPADRAAMARELAAAVVMAAMSSYEAHPVAVMEAVTLGLPVVGFDVAGIGDLVEDGLVSGISAQAGPQEIAAALEQELKAAQAGGFRPHQVAALALPTWEGSAQALGAVYQDVLAAHAGGSARHGRGPR